MRSTRRLGWGLLVLASCSPAPTPLNVQPTPEVIVSAAPVAESVEATKASKPLFTWRAEPVHPRCVLALVGGDEQRSVALDAFADDRGTVKRVGGDVIYEYPDDFAGLMREPFVEYEVLASRGRRHVLRYLYNGGGTGYFSGLVFVELGDDELVLRRWIHGGDRCNGGLDEATSDGGSIVYTAQITPVDLVGLGRDPKDEDLRLESSATSCFAKARYRFDLAEETAGLTGVLFEGPAEDRAGWTDRFAQQSCFNRVFNRHLGERSVEQVKSFVAAFDDTCS